MMPHKYLHGRPILAVHGILFSPDSLTAGVWVARSQVSCNSNSFFVRKNNNTKTSVNFCLSFSVLYQPLLWSPYGIGQTIIFCRGFFSSPIFFFSSPNLSHRRLDVYRTSTHGVALVKFKMQV